MNLFRFFSVILTFYCVVFSGVKSDTSYISGGSYTERLHTPSAGITRANIDTSHSRHATADSATIPVFKGTKTFRDSAYFAGGVSINRLWTGAANITNGTASRVVVTDANKNLSSATVTSTELGYLSGKNSVIDGSGTSGNIPVFSGTARLTNGPAWNSGTSTMTGNISGNSSTATSVNSTNYNSYSTTTSGWSSTSYTYVYWHRIGSVVFVLFSIQGTSDSGIATFTLPYSSIVQANFVCNYQDNGGSYQVGYGYTSTNVVYICAGNWGGAYNAFTPSGNKHVLGSFIYFAQ